MSLLSEADPEIGPWAASLWPNGIRTRNELTRHEHEASSERQWYLSRPGFIEMSNDEIGGYGIPAINPEDCVCNNARRRVLTKSGLGNRHEFAFKKEASR